MGKGKLFETRPPGAVTLVETPVSRSYARKAQFAFYGFWASVGAVATAVLLTVVDPVTAVAFGALAGGVVGLAAAILVRIWPVARLLWHWAAEVALFVAVLVPSTLLGWILHPLVPVGVLLALAVGCWFVRPVRRWLTRWGWCVVDRHRLRLSFAEFIRSANRTNPGRLPLILAARPTPAGERVWVWLRPGLALEDLDGKTAKLAVACWAADVRVVQASPNRAALIRIDITRRDPLLSLIRSPLAGLVPADHVVPAPPSDGALLGLALDLPDVPVVIPTPRAPGRR